MADLIYQGTMTQAKAEEIIGTYPNDIDPNTYVIGEPRKDDVYPDEPLIGQEIVGVYRQRRADEPQAITDEGFTHLNEVMGDYFGVRVTREYFDAHEQQFVEGVDTSFGFYQEANDGAMSDTLVRDYIATTIARLLTTFASWPCYGDGPKVGAKFKREFYTNAKATDGILVREDLDEEFSID